MRFCAEIFQSKISYQVFVYRFCPHFWLRENWGEEKNGRKWEDFTFVGREISDLLLLCLVI